MIVVDTSALIAILLDEPGRAACFDALADEPERVISAVNLAEALIVAGRRGFGVEMAGLISRLEQDVAPVTADSARRAAAAYSVWGKGVHPARLNLADCFAYELAMSRRAQLLYVGQDFAQTDVASALPLADL